MLDRAKVMYEIQQVAHKLFSYDSHQYNRAYAVWQRIVHDPAFATQVTSVQAPWPLPTWNGALDATTTIPAHCSIYTACSVDGSQIYPDRHQGSRCCLVNVGSVTIEYSTASGRVHFESTPYLFIDDTYQGFLLTHDLIDCVRQEYECMIGVQRAQQYHTDTSACVLFFDGTLIFWHLETHDVEYKRYFLPHYCNSLMALAHANIPTIGYISLPRSKELVNLVRFALYQEGMPQEEANQVVASVTDTTLLAHWLPVYARTNVFASNSTICYEYPALLRPHFWYLHVGNEIARIEAPAWVAQDTALVDHLSSIILDQCVKGNGYPVVLAEAHEQAVIKSADRDFFYHCIRKSSIEQNYRISPSQKNIKKRGLGF